jgi:hypothetical protein
VKYSCDITLPAEHRYLSEKFRVLSRHLEIYRLPLAYALELAALMHTPGITDLQLRIMFHWNQHDLAAARILAEHYAERVQDMARENAASITEDDGRALLQAMLDAKPRHAHSVPLYCTRYLQAQRRRGAKPRHLAAQFNTTSARISRWWRADLFDPLSGKLRPKSLPHGVGLVL